MSRVPPCVIIAPCAAAFLLALPPISSADLVLQVAQAATTDSQVQLPRFSRQDGITPFPGTKKVDEILANVRAVIIRRGLYRQRGLQRLLDTKSVVVSRLIEVDTSPELKPYYLIYVDTLAGSAIAIVGLEIQTGEFVVLANHVDEPERPKLVPELSSVASALAARYGGPVSARYFWGPNDFQGSYFVPLVIAETPRGRVVVDRHLDTFEERGVEDEPAGLAGNQKKEWLTRLRHDGQWGVVRNGKRAYQYALAGKISAERK